ncbi:uncharacterized protein LOC108094866 [Drosophila ficusphila]|uniref:uncharacterized protein LOC108094866 n=1 Tax=Drosophila ficusphila TaxID=30025 RepID=UPI0007E77B91|nr:uncharacterized protein LOC108094866 [Drosophila ficusphila]
MSAEETEAAFKRHEGIGAQVKQAYDEAIGQIFSDLSPSDLDAWATIFEEHEDSSLDTESLINNTSSRMTKVVHEMNKCFFASNDVENKLITLEMLKEHFAAYEGKNWKFNNISPEELTRPLRMRNLDFSLYFMQRQLEAQAKELEIGMFKSIANRERLQNVQNERVKLTAKIELHLCQYKDLKPQLIELDQAINNSYLAKENTFNN